MKRGDGGDQRCARPDGLLVGDRRQPLRAEAGQRDQHGPYLATLLGQHVHRAGSGWLELVSSDDTRLLEIAEAIGQQVGGHAGQCVA